MARIPYAHVPIQAVGEFPIWDTTDPEYKKRIKQIAKRKHKKFAEKWRAKKRKEEMESFSRRLRRQNGIACKQLPVRVKDAAVAAGGRGNNGEKLTPDPTTIYSAVATDFDAGITIAIAAWAILVTLKWIKRSVR